MADCNGWDSWIQSGTLRSKSTVPESIRFKMNQQSASCKQLLPFLLSSLQILQHWTKSHSICMSQSQYATSIPDQCRHYLPVEIFSCGTIRLTLLDERVHASLSTTTYWAGNVQARCRTTARLSLTISNLLALTLPLQYDHYRQDKVLQWWKLGIHFINPVLKVCNVLSVFIECSACCSSMLVRCHIL